MEGRRLPAGTVLEPSPYTLLRDPFLAARGVFWASFFWGGRRCIPRGSLFSGTWTELQLVSNRWRPNRWEFQKCPLTLSLPIPAQGLYALNPDIPRPLRMSGRLVVGEGKKKGLHGNRHHLPECPLSWSFDWTRRSGLQDLLLWRLILCEHEVPFIYDYPSTSVVPGSLARFSLVLTFLQTRNPTQLKMGTVVLIGHHPRQCQGCFRGY